MFAPPTLPTDPDVSIRETDNDAAHARLSAVRKGYLEDPFIQYFVPRPHLVPTRPPLINIGTYLRSQAVDNLVKGWLNLDLRGGKKQIVSLGAGSDTRFWRLVSEGYGEQISKYIEIDFVEVTSKKARVIRKHPELESPLGPELRIESGGTSLKSQVYHLTPSDLRLPPETSLNHLLEDLSPETPTLFIAECVFPYMEPVQSSSLMHWFTTNFATSGGIIYEMFNLQDSFGEVMRKNLQARRVQLPGIEPISTLESLRRRMETQGFVLSKATTLKNFRMSGVTGSEAGRIRRLEMLDEIEELDLVLDHYALTWGASSGNLSLWNVTSPE